MHKHTYEFFATQSLDDNQLTDEVLARYKGGVVLMCCKAFCGDIWIERRDIPAGDLCFGHRRRNENLAETSSRDH
jgi:hypothetical protein